MARTYIAKQPDKAAIVYIAELKIWAVPSASDPSKVYEVSKPTDKYVCNCPDYFRRHLGNGTECKHGSAVRELVDSLKPNVTA